MCLQDALGGIKEAYRAQPAIIAAQLARSSAAAVGGTIHLQAEREFDRWDAYKSAHMASALQGAMLLFNRIDLELKAYSRLQNGNATIWLTAGPLYSAVGPSTAGTVTLLELIRALCNYFRHRDEWALGMITKGNASIKRLTSAGLNPLSESTFADMLQLMPYDNWLDLESDLIAAVATLP